MSFGAQVSAITEGYKGLLKDARTKTVIGIVNQAQRPKARGGRMPVDTGYLRRSIRGALNTRPSESDGTPLAALLEAGLDGDVMIGWHANYAGFQEIRSGFMRGALDNAQLHADRAVTR
jgi:hypothetical protein